MVKKSTILYTIFFLLIFTASVPYLAYGVSAIRSGYEVVGGLNASGVQVTGKMGILFGYCKDFFSAGLLALTFVFTGRLKKNFFAGIVLTFIYGFVGLISSGHSDLRFLLAGARTFMFFCAAGVFFLSYIGFLYDNDCIRRLSRITHITIIMQVVIVALQVTMSRSWGRFGSGAYRFSGLFPGSGNLGCYAIAVLLFLMILNQKYRMLSNALYLMDGFFLLFLSIASGTRTCMILVAFCYAYGIFSIYGRVLHLDRKVVLLFLAIMMLVFGSSAMSTIVAWTGRGALMDSGGGRIAFFTQMLNTASPLEFMIGRGIGVGTNASISMGLQGTQVSDSTLNLIFTQFGVIGLIVGLIQFGKICVKIYRTEKKYLNISICMILTLCVMLVVGNLFEHIAMCLYFVLSYFMIVEHKEADDNNEESIQL